MTLVILRKNLSKNEELEDVIPGGHLEIDDCRTDLSFVFLSLFMP